jgi:hypothetical protein
MKRDTGMKENLSVISIINEKILQIVASRRDFIASITSLI